MDGDVVGEEEGMEVGKEEGSRVGALVIFEGKCTK